MNSILDLPFIGATRRNHALEHATLHVLAQKYPNRMLGGHSNPTGFFIVGDVPLEAVTDAATGRCGGCGRGERELAIHPGCGTNFATSALLGDAGVVRAARGPFGYRAGAAAASRDRPGRCRRCPQPSAGTDDATKITTDAEMGAMHVTGVRHSLRGRVTAHRVLTAGS
jgi:hypothetical protein